MIGQFKMEGDLAKALNAIADPLKKKAVLYEGLEMAAQPMKARMVSLAPKSDEAPHIYQNITTSRARTVDGVRLHEDEAALAVGPSTRVPHAFLQEFGTTFHGQQPFVRPAFDSEHRTSLGILGGFLWDLIRRRTGRSVAGRGL